MHQENEYYREKEAADIVSHDIFEPNCCVLIFRINHGIFKMGHFFCLVGTQAIQPGLFWYGCYLAPARVDLG